MSNSSKKREKQKISFQLTTIVSCFVGHKLLACTKYEQIQGKDTTAEHTSPALNINLCLSKKSKIEGEVSWVSIPVPSICAERATGCETKRKPMDQVKGRNFLALVVSCNQLSDLETEQLHKSISKGA